MERREAVTNRLRDVPQNIVVLDSLGVESVGIPML
jgi:hypothetical protein